MSKRKQRPVCKVCDQIVKGKRGVVTAPLHPDYSGPLHTYCAMILILAKGLKFVPRATP